MISANAHEFGTRLRALREIRDWNQHEVPGFSRAQVVRWETGAGFPRPADIVRLAELFGVTTDYLLRGEEAAAGALQRDPHGTLLLSRATSDEAGIRQVVPFRLDHEGNLWGHRIDAFWVADARAEADVDGLHAGDALLLARTSLETVREDQTGPLYAVAQPGRRPTLLRVLRLMPPPDEDGEIMLVVRGRQPETVAPGEALYRVVAVVRPAGLLDGGAGGTRDPNATEHRSEQEAVQRLAAVAGVPAPVLEAAVGAAHEAVEDGATVRTEPPDVAALESLAQVGAEAVALVDGGSTDPRLLRAVRAIARRMGRLVRQSEEQPTDLVSMAEAARLIGVTRQAVHLAVTSGRLPTYGDGRVGRVSLREARMLVGGDAADPAASRRGRGASPGGQTGPKDADSPGSEAHRQVAGPDDQETRPDPAQGQGRGGPGAAPEDAAARDAEPEPRRVLLADLVVNPPEPLEANVAAKMHEWVRWADARYDDQTMLLYEQDPPADLPPPWDYHHYDYWETRRSAARGLQWWEYPKEHKLAEYARFIRRMEEMYRDGDQKRRSALWATAREEYGPDAPLPDDDDSP